MDEVYKAEKVCTGKSRKHVSKEHEATLQKRIFLVERVQPWTRKANILIQNV